MKARVLPVPAKLPKCTLVCGFVFDGETPELHADLRIAIARAHATGDLLGEFRSVSLFHQGTRDPVQRLGFVGLGKRKDLTTERLRQVAALAQGRAEAQKIEHFVLLVGADDHGHIEPADAGRAIAEGLILGAYKYQAPSKTKPKSRHAQRCDVIYLGKAARAFEAGFEVGCIGADATVYARDLENLPANLCTPTFLAKEAKKLAGGAIKVRVLEKKDMERLKMGALLGVTKGTEEPPKLVVLEYVPKRYKKTVCIVGKGLTFDSGGISIKPSAKMDEMRMDMCGAGAVLGLFHALGNGGLVGAAQGTRIVGIAVCAENMPDANAQRPGDVVTAIDGHTIEVLNTDAEGRLVLADALTFAKREFEPDQMIDLATLTGAVITALGHECAGIMGTDQKVVKALIAAGKQADEPLWELPLWEPHKEQMRSKFADLQNINGGGHGNGTIAGAAFLAFFVEGTPWAHLDIAGTAWDQRVRDYYKGGAAGTAVRMLLQWVRSLV